MRKKSKIIFSISIAIFLFFFPTLKSEAVCWGKDAMVKTVEELPGNCNKCPSGTKCCIEELEKYVGGKFCQASGRPPGCKIKSGNVKVLPKKYIISYIKGNNQYVIKYTSEFLKDPNKALSYLRTYDIDFTGGCIYDCPGGLTFCGRDCDDPNTKICECVKCTSCHLLIFLKRVVDFLIGRGMPLFLILTVSIGGFIYITSGGNEARLRKAKILFLAAVVGAIITLASFTIVNSIVVWLTPANSPFQNWNTIECPIP